MSKRRTSEGAGWVDEERLPTGPNGRALCRRCGDEVPKGRKTFCSNDCVHEWRLRTQPTYVRQCMFKRDKGVCRECGCDTVQLIKDLETEFGVQPRYYGGRYVAASTEGSPRQEEFEARLAELCISVHRWDKRKSYRGIWDADHIKPVSEGGGECGLDNYRTLCMVCHQRASAELAARQAAQRKFDKAHRFKNRRLV